MGNPGVTGVVCADAQGLCVAGSLFVVDGNDVSGLAC